LEIAKLWLWNSGWQGQRVLDGHPVTTISSSLDVVRQIAGQPFRLRANEGKSYQGSNVLGLGFMLEPKIAAELIDSDPRNGDVLFPYLNGKDLNEHPQHQASRWVINFFDWPIERAETYPACFEIVERLVKPERLQNRDRNRREFWWRFTRPALELYGSISGFKRTLAIAQVSKTLQPTFVATRQVLSHKTVVFAYDDDGHFGLLSSSMHWWWALSHTATMRTDPSYSPSDVFVTFPQPEPQDSDRWEALEASGSELNDLRAALMVRTDLGLTKTYNRVHSAGVHHPDFVRLRELHVQLDHAVRDAYGWGDLELNHHHWETPQGVRFTVSPEAKDELLDRLLELNHQRYAAEVAAGLHSKRKPPAKRASKPRDAGQEALL